MKQFNNIDNNSHAKAAVCKLQRYSLLCTFLFLMGVFLSFPDSANAFRRGGQPLTPHEHLAIIRAFRAVHTHVKGSGRDLFLQDAKSKSGLAPLHEILQRGGELTPADNAQINKLVQERGTEILLALGRRQEVLREAYQAIKASPPQNPQRVADIQGAELWVGSILYKGDGANEIISPVAEYGRNRDIIETTQKNLNSLISTISLTSDKATPKNAALASLTQNIQLDTQITVNSVIHSVARHQAKNLDATTVQHLEALNTKIAELSKWLNSPDYAHVPSSVKADIARRAAQLVAGAREAGQGERLADFNTSTAKATQKEGGSALALATTLAVQDGIQRDVHQMDRVVRDIRDGKRDAKTLSDTEKALYKEQQKTMDIFAEAIKGDAELARLAKNAEVPEKASPLELQKLKEFASSKEGRIPEATRKTIEAFSQKANEAVEKLAIKRKAKELFDIGRDGKLLTKYGAEKFRLCFPCIVVGAGIGAGMGAAYQLLTSYFNQECTAANLKEAGSCPEKGTYKEEDDKGKKGQKTSSLQVQPRNYDLHEGGGSLSGLSNSIAKSYEEKARAQKESQQMQQSRRPVELSGADKNTKRDSSL